MERRGFFQTLSAYLGGGVLALMGMVPGVANLAGTALKKNDENEDWIEIGPLQTSDEDRPVAHTITLRQKDGWETIERPQTVYVVTAPEGPTVFSSVCPHLACGVTFDEEKGRFLCPCHRSIFDVTGTVVSGPSPRGLDTLPVKVHAGRIYCRWVVYETGRSEKVEV